MGKKRLNMKVSFPSGRRGKKGICSSLSHEISRISKLEMGTTVKIWTKA